MIKISPRDIRIHKEELLDVLHIGIPAGLQQALYSIANVVISSAVNTFGADATTGISIANTFDGILYQIATAPALAVMPYVSQNLGAGNLKRAKQAIVRGMMIAVVMAGSLGALSAIFSGPLSSIMAENAAQIEYSQQKMMIISSTYFTCGINNILSETMRGFRRPLIPTVATMIYMCLLRFVWVWWIFPHYPNLTFLYLVWPIGWILSIITVGAFLIFTIKNDNWKKRFVN
jgi:Na+-driven multidrug efflux pump